MPRYSISNAPTEVIGLYAGSGVFRGRLGDISIVYSVLYFLRECHIHGYLSQ